MNGEVVRLVEEALGKGKSRAVGLFVHGNALRKGRRCDQIPKRSLRYDFRVEVGDPPRIAVHLLQGDSEGLDRLPEGEVELESDVG